MMRPKWLATFVKPWTDSENCWVAAFETSSPEVVESLAAGGGLDSGGLSALVEEVVAVSCVNVIYLFCLKSLEK